MRLILRMLKSYQNFRVTRQIWANNEYITGTDLMITKGKVSEEQIKCVFDDI